jgi:hypothetical protein
MISTKQKRKNILSRANFSQILSRRHFNPVEKQAGCNFFETVVYYRENVAPSGGRKALPLYVKNIWISYPDIRGPVRLTLPFGL